MKFLGQGFQTLKHNNKTDTQTDATELITALHLRLVMKRNGWDETSWMMTIATGCDKLQYVAHVRVLA